MLRSDLAQHAADTVEQVGAQLELAERVGEVAGDREGAPLRQHVDPRRTAEQRGPRR